MDDGTIVFDNPEVIYHRIESATAASLDTYGTLVVIYHRIKRWS
ncbi:MAG: hypothetical protein RQ885_09220 [Desulfurococcales archaeon]|nr:hypothetical protein [Desulfurococcales archaeon]